MTSRSVALMDAATTESDFSAKPLEIRIGMHASAEGMFIGNEV